MDASQKRFFVFFRAPRPMYRARTLSRFQSGAAEVFSKNTSAFSAAAAAIALEDQAGRHGVDRPAVHLFLFSRRVQDRVRLD